MEKLDEGNLSSADFAQIIVEHYNDLTKSEKRIADYLVKIVMKLRFFQLVKLPNAWISVKLPWCASPGLWV